MVLELAERPSSKYIKVGAYTRNKNVSAHKRRRPVLNSGDNHIYIPAHLNDGNGMYVREDIFDDLSENEWDTLMDNVLDFQPGMSELSSKARRAEKKAVKSDKKNNKHERKEKKKSDKNTRKNTRREGIDAKRKAKGDSKVIRANAKQDKANRPKGGGGGSDDSEDGDDSGSGGSGSRAGSIFDKIISKASGAYNKFKGGSSGGGSSPDADGGDDAGDDTTKPKGAPGEMISILGMEMTKTTAIIAGVATTAVVGGILYKVLKHK